MSHKCKIFIIVTKRLTRTGNKVGTDGLENKLLQNAYYECERS